MLPARFKNVMRQYLLTILLSPLVVIVFSSFIGADLNAAFTNLVRVLFTFPNALVTWGILLITAFLSSIFLGPVFHFLLRNRLGHRHHAGEAERAIRTIDIMPKFITVLSVGGFAVGSFTLIIVDPTLSLMAIGSVYLLLKSLASGLFTATIISLNLESVLFPIKRQVILVAPDTPQRYRSYFVTMASTIAAMLLFLLFQSFEVVWSFLMIGMENTSTPMPSIADASQLLNLGQTFRGIDSAMKLFLVRVLVYMAISFHIVRRLRSQVSNPLNTIRQRLSELNLRRADDISEIEIINNNEFNSVYREINTLIARQQTELRHSRGRLDTIINAAADPIIAFDSQAHITLFNPAARRLLGFTADDMLGNDLTAYLTPPEFTPGENSCNRDNLFGFLENTGTQLKRMNLSDSSGEIIPVEANYSKSRGDNGDFYTVIIRDIRNQLEYEKTLTEARIAAETANRMKSEFLANMSHELRTPLNAILGYTQLMADDRNLTDGQTSKIRTISNSGEHLLALINDILDISKIEAGKIEINETVFNLKQFMQDLQDMFQIKCREKGLSFYVEYLGELPSNVSGDLGKLRQIMINLLGNAVKFTSDGGIAVAVGAEGSNIRFSVRDSGKGIPDGDKHNILKPFTQSTNSDHEGGTGLGLAISSRFVKMMGGDLNLESRVGEGSTFHFAIPLPESEGSPMQSRERRRVLAVRGDRQPRALVVDDKTDNRLILKEMLERAGFSVMEAGDGLQALERSAEYKPEIIFMDIKMPNMDGYAAVKALKADSATAAIPVFALTASAFKHDEKRIFDSGFDGFLAKPFQQHSLFELVEKHSEIEFVYDIPSDSGPKEDEVHLDDDEMLAEAGCLDGDSLRELEDALLINDFSRIVRLSRPLMENCPKLAGYISGLASAFNEDGLRHVIEVLKGESV